MPWRRSLSVSSSSPVRRLPPGLRHPPSRLTGHELLCCFQAQEIIVQCLIALFGPDFRVSYTTEVLPESTVVASLRDYANLCELINSGFCLVDPPPATITIPPSETYFPPWSPLRG